MSDIRLSSPSSSSQDKPSPPRIDANHVEANDKNGILGSKKSNHDANNYIVKRERPSRACTQRAAAKIQAAAASEAAEEKKHRKKAALRRGKVKEEVEVEVEDEEVEEEENQQCSRIVTPLVGEPEPSQLPRWKIRGMWQLASVLNFLNVFRPLLNVKVEFSVEELETALITPNKTLAEIHMPLLRAIHPITRMALGHSTWVTVLCRKLRDWWHWVAEGEIPIVASHGAEIQAYNELDPAVRVVILKALCDIRVEQDDIRNHIDNSIKQGVHLSAFCKQRIGGNSHGVSYWYEDDPIIGHRLYREIRQVEVKKGKGKNTPPVPDSSYEWSTVATNLDEFRDVSEKLFSSRNRTEVSVGKKLINDMLPEIEKVHKRKEKQVKRQHRQALMLDNMVNVERLVAGRALRDRKKVTYTFDDYDRSIDEALKHNKFKQSSSFEPTTRRENDMKVETRANGRWGAAPSHSLDTHSPKSPDSDAFSDENGDEEEEERLDRSERRKQRPQRYSAGEFIEEVSDQEADSDDDIEGEAVYDEEYLRLKKRRRQSSSEDEIPEEEEEEDDDDDYLSPSEDEDSDVPRKIRRLPERTRKVTKSRSAKVARFGLRRSERATRNRIDYRRIEMSDESDTEKKNNGDFDENSNEGYSTENEEETEEDDEQDTDNMETKSDEHLNNEGFSVANEETEDDEEEEDDTDNVETKGDEHLNNNKGFSVENEETEDEEAMDNPEPRGDERVEEDQDHHHHHHETREKEPTGLPEKLSRPHEDEEDEGERKRQFLDLNELAPGSGLDDGSIEDDETDN